MSVIRRVFRPLISLVPDKIFTAYQEEITYKRNECLKRSLRSCGSDLYLASPVVIRSAEKVSIGEKSAINEFVHILGGGNVTIGNGVWIANHASIISVTHPTDVEFIGGHPQIEKPIVIEDNVWIGSHAMILPGVTLGRSCIVGAGSVVTRDVPAYAIVVGSPARLMRMKNIEPSD